MLLISASPASSASRSLALAKSDYPHGVRVAVLPPVNGTVDQYFAPAHRSSFETLHRVDGLGWLQFGTWSFATGSGKARQVHDTHFGYVVNVFHSTAQASHALANVKLHTTLYHIAHLPGRRYAGSSVQRSVVFLFFSYKMIEVEAYYEYLGVAPTAISRELSHDLGRQASHLAAIVRGLSKDLLSAPPPTATPTATDTPVPTATATATPTALPTDTPTSVPTTPPTATPTAIRLATATPTPTSTPTVTPTPVVLAVTISTGQVYPRGGTAVATMHVTENGQAAGGVKLVVTFEYPGAPVECDTVSDAQGNAQCSSTVPDLPDGTQVNVVVHAFGPQFSQASAGTSFVVRGP